MKLIVRVIIIAVLWLILWPFLINKKFGFKYKKNQLKSTIIFANHYSNLDPFILKIIFFRRKLVFAATEDVKKKTWSRILAWAFDTIYIKSEGMNYGFIKEAIKVINQGGTLCIFPEGYVNPLRYSFLDFMPSYVFIAKKTNANVLPVFIDPKKGLFSRNQIYICEMITAEAYQLYTELEDLNMMFLSKPLEASAIVRKETDIHNEIQRPS